MNDAEPTIVSTDAERALCAIEDEIYPALASGDPDQLEAKLLELDLEGRHGEALVAYVIDRTEGRLARDNIDVVLARALKRGDSPSEVLSFLDRHDLARHYGLEKLAERLLAATRVKAPEPAPTRPMGIAERVRAAQGKAPVQPPDRTGKRDRDR